VSDTGDALGVTDSVSIPRSELTVRATRSGGPGGQHVNTSSTRIEITWDVARTGALTDEERTRVLSRLGARVSEDGTVRVVASDSRSQRQNRERAEERLVDLIRRALAVAKPRKRTRVPKGAVEARLERKRRRGERKRSRRWTGDDAL
jgi:ribosome-associated protein